ncbi:MAG: hypothetical protein IPJ75_08960 [Ignavibacteriales bacterium]|nr:hypothetical protein [Ignavibacteriales bacterium]
MAIEEDKLYGIMLSVSEATTNAIFHANKKILRKLFQYPLLLVQKFYRLNQRSRDWI